MDGFTSNLFLSFSQIFIAILFIYYVLAKRLKSWYIYTYILGLILQSLGVLMFALQEILDIFIIQNIGASLLFIGYALVIYNVISFDQVFRKNLVITLSVLTLVLVIIALSIIHQSPMVKAVFLSIGGAVFYIFGGGSLLFRKNRTSLQNVIGINFLLFTFAWFFWAYYIFAIGSAYHSGTINLGVDVLRIVGLANILVTSVGYLLLLKEQDEFKIKRQNEIIQSDNQRLKELNSKKNKFFYIISHDLKNPMGAMTQLGFMLHKYHDKIPPREKEQMINNIYESAEKSYNLLNNLLDWARSESSKIQLKPEHVNLSKLVHNNLELHKSHIESKGIKIDNKLPTDFFCYVDNNSVDTVIRNIISNAIKFTNKGGSINIFSRLISDSKQIQLVISDTGVGIPDEVQSQLFEIDSNYSSTGTANEKGTGLGLKLCKEFMEKNKGEIYIKSKLGEGTEIVLELPKEP